MAALLNPASAAAAYSNTVRAALPTPLEDAPAPIGQSFANYITEAADNAVKVGQKSEQQTIQAIAGKGDLTDVVTAVANAELALQTVVAVRDRVVTAYQQIMSMPI